MKPDHRWQPNDVYEMTGLAGETSLPSWMETRSKHSGQHQHQAESEKAFIWLRTQALPRVRPCWSNPVSGHGGETVPPSRLTGSQGLCRTCVLLRADSESGKCRKTRGWRARHAFTHGGQAGPCGSWGLYTWERWGDQPAHPPILAGRPGPGTENRPRVP